MLCYFDLKETIFKSHVKQPVQPQPCFVQHQLGPGGGGGRGWAWPVAAQGTGGHSGIPQGTAFPRLLEQPPALSGAGGLTPFHFHPTSPPRGLRARTNPSQVCSPRPLAAEERGGAQVGSSDWRVEPAAGGNPLELCREGKEAGEHLRSRVSAPSLAEIF